MAHQDYISRSSNKKNNPYKKNSKQEATGLSLKVKFITLFAVIATAAFGYFLYTLNGIEPENTDTPTTAPAKKTTATTLPKPPEEKWEYIEKLKGNEEVKGGEYEVVDKGPYKMQCGSFRTVSKAQELKAQIAFAGLIAQVSKSTGTNGVYHRVYLGPYQKKREAERDKHLLKRNNMNHCRISPW